MERPVVRDKRPGTILSSAEKIETSVLVFVNFCTDIHNRHGRIKFSGLRCDQIGPDLRELTRNQTRIPAHINEACARPPSCIVRARVCLSDSHHGRENSDKSATVTRPVYYSSRMTFCAESFYGMKLFYVNAGRGYSFALDVPKLTLTFSHSPSREQLSLAVLSAGCRSFYKRHLRSLEPTLQRYTRSVPSSKNSWAIYFLLANHFAH